MELEKQQEFDGGNKELRKLIAQWVSKNGGNIRKKLLDRRKDVLENWPDSAEQFSFEHRSLSEMNLCDAVYRMPLPPGFGVKFGNVKIGEDNRLLEHDFAARGDLIFDAVASQFFFKEGISSNSAQQEMVSLAPDLFFIYKDIVILCGKKEDIARLLHMEYLWEE